MKGGWDPRSPTFHNMRNLMFMVAYFFSVPLIFSFLRSIYVSPFFQREFFIWSIVTFSANSVQLDWACTFEPMVWFRRKPNRSPKTIDNWQFIHSKLHQDIFIYIMLSKFSWHAAQIHPRGFTATSARDQIDHSARDLCGKLYCFRMQWKLTRGWKLSSLHDDHMKSIRLSPIHPQQFPWFQWSHCPAWDWWAIPCAPCKRWTREFKQKRKRRRGGKLPKFLNSQFPSRKGMIQILLD